MGTPDTQSGSNRASIRPVLVFVGFVIIFLLVGNLLFDNLRNSVRREVQGNIAAVGALKANQIEYWLEDRAADAKVFSESSFFSREVKQWLHDGARNDARRGHLVERLAAFMNGHKFHSIVLYNASGRLMLSVGADVKEDGGIAAEVRRVAVSGRLSFVDLHRHKDVSFPVAFGFISPLREGGVTYGAVYLVEDPEQYLYPLVHSWPSSSETAETVLVRREGSDVLFLDKLRNRDEPSLTYRMPLDTPLLAAAIALRGKQGLLEHAHDYQGNPVLSFVAEIKGTLWVLISKIDEDEAYRTVDKMQRVASIIELFVFGLVGAWIWQWRRSVKETADAAVMKERIRADALQMEGEKRFRTIFENAALPMMRISLQGSYLEVNDAWCKMFGYSREEALSGGLSWQKITYADDLDKSLSLSKKLISGEIRDFKVEKRYYRKDGEVLWGELQVALARDENGMPEYYVSAIQDITERKQLAQKLEDNLSILKMALEGAQEAVWEWDMVSGKAIFSPQYYTMLGYVPDEFPASQQEWLSHIHPDECDSVLAKIEEELIRKQDVYVVEYRMRAKDGRYRWIQGRARCSFDADGKPERMVGINMDITERKQSEQQISFMAYHDKLTGLPNRALLFDRLSQAMSQARRDEKYVALLFVDLDGFKLVNDDYGHEAGDTVLKMSAQRFLACVRAVDTVSRFGGDEFAIVLGNLDEPQQAASVAEKIVQAFAQSLMLADGNECVVGASVGISIYPENGSAMDRLLTAADQAMYESKRRGKNTFTFYEEKTALLADAQWIKFEKSHLVGVQEIDEQHRNLMYLVNRLNDGLTRSDSNESVLQLLDELLVATVHHFDTESRYMTSYHYPDQSGHEMEHAKLVNEAQDFKEQFSQGRELLVLQSIKDWLLGHIAYSDKKMAAYLLEHGAK
jgi:diguanylate cyclase (GGDEF)-like protein/PAS domain S-box-containing protein/hemerythrin-like metal-binding protein